MEVDSREYILRRRMIMQKKGFRISGVISSQMDVFTGPFSGQRIFKLPNPMCYYLDHHPMEILYAPKWLGSFVRTLICHSCISSFKVSHCKISSASIWTTWVLPEYFVYIDIDMIGLIELITIIIHIMCNIFFDISFSLLNHSSGFQFKTACMPLAELFLADIASQTSWDWLHRSVVAIHLY